MKKITMMMAVCIGMAGAASAALVTTTTFDGAGDLTSAANWDNGLPSNTNPGLVSGTTAGSWLGTMWQGYSVRQTGGTMFAAGAGAFAMRGGAENTTGNTILEIDDTSNTGFGYKNLDVSGQLTLWNQYGSTGSTGNILSLLNGYVDAGILNCTATANSTINILNGKFDVGSLANAKFTLNMLAGGTGEFNLADMDDAGVAKANLDNTILNFEGGSAASFTIASSNVTGSAQGTWETKIAAGTVTIGGATATAGQFKIEDVGATGTKIQLFSSVLPFPAPPQGSLTSTNLIPNGDFATITNASADPFAKGYWNVNGSKGDFFGGWDRTADLVGWSPYYADPSNLISKLGNPFTDDPGGYEAAASATRVEFEAESGTLGSNFDPAIVDALASGGQYITSEVNQGGTGADNVVTYSVSFAEAGTYDLYARIYVGPNGPLDDSFFFGSDFSTPSPTAWILANGLSTESAEAYAWVNLSDFTVGNTFTVAAAGVQTFQIAGREDGLRLDAFAFVTVAAPGTYGTGGAGLDGSYYSDTFVGGDVIQLTSAQNYRNGMKSEDILNGVTIDSGGMYQLEVDVDSEYTNHPTATFTSALTGGTDATNTANAISGTLQESPLDDLFGGGLMVSQVSGADLIAASQVNVMFHIENTKQIAGFPDSIPGGAESVHNADYLAKMLIHGVSLVEVYVFSAYDVNTDRVVNQIDLDLANSYLDGSVDGGDDAATRQADKMAEGNSAAEALAALNLTVFDVDGNDTFNAADVAAIEANISPVMITSGAMDGSGNFVVTVDISSMVPGPTLYLKRSEDLVTGSFSEVVDSAVTVDSTLTLTDTNAPAGQAFYQVTD